MAEERTAQLTMLNSMADGEFVRSLDRQQGWGIRWVDLKDAIFGKRVTELTADEAEEAARLIAARGMAVYCLSTQIFQDDLEQGEAVFRQRHLAALERMARLVPILRPRVVRVLAAQSSRRDTFQDAVVYLRGRHPWVIGLYREASDLVTQAGSRLTIENESHNCVISRPGEALDFFSALDREGRVDLTWDVQNLWQMGAFPTLDVYRELKPLIGYYHVKGGIADESGRLKWRSLLADASWPVADITRAVVADGVSPVICLNPSHGGRKPGYDDADWVRRDFEYMRELLQDIGGGAG